MAQTIKHVYDTGCKHISMAWAIAVFQVVFSFCASCVKINVMLSYTECCYITYFDEFCDIIHVSIVYLG